MPTISKRFFAFAFVFAATIALLYLTDSEAPSLTFADFTSKYTALVFSNCATNAALASLCCLDFKAASSQNPFVFVAALFLILAFVRIMFGSMRSVLLPLIVYVALAVAKKFDLFSDIIGR